MIRYEYVCPECGLEMSGFYPMGKAPQTVQCEKCNCQSERRYSFSVNVPNPTHPARKGRGKG